MPQFGTNSLSNPGRSPQSPVEFFQPPIPQPGEFTSLDKWFIAPEYPAAYLNNYDHGDGARDYFAALASSGSGSQRNFALINQPQNETWHAEFPAIVPVQPRRTADLSQFDIDPKQLTLKESVFIDKFKPIYPDILRLPARVAESQFDVSPAGLTQQEFPFVEKWAQPPSQPTRVPAHVQPEQIVIDANELTQKEAISIDRWEPHYPDWLSRIYPRALFESSSGSQRNFTLVNHPGNETWHVEFPSTISRLYPYATYDTQASSFVELTAQSESIFVDKWFQPASIPIRIPTRSIESQSEIDPKQLTQPETVHVDAWFRNQEYPQAFERLSIHTSLPSGAVYGLPEILTIDKWHSQYPDACARQFNEAVETVAGVFIPVIVEVITLDKWFLQTSQPTRPPGRCVDLLQFTIDAKLLTQKETVTVDKFNPNYPAWDAHVYPEAVYVASGAYFAFEGNYPKPGRKGHSYAYLID